MMLLYKVSRLLTSVRAQASFVGTIPLISFLYTSSSSGENTQNTTCFTCLSVRPLQVTCLIVFLEKVLRRLDRDLRGVLDRVAVCIVSWSNSRTSAQRLCAVTGIVTKRQSQGYSQIPVLILGNAMLVPPTLEHCSSADL